LTETYSKIRGGLLTRSDGLFQSNPNHPMSTD
jgi:hypothetical protein